MSDPLIAEISGALQTADWSALVAALGVLVLGFGIAAALSRVCDHRLLRVFPSSSPASRALVARLARLAVLAGTVLVALQVLGISVTTLLAAGTVVFVGLGLAFQKILQSLVAGTLLLLEREIEPGDVLRFEGQEYRVVSIGLRTTQMESRFAETLILPNFLLATSPVTNLTHRDAEVFAKLEVQVAYGTDSALVEKALLRAAEGSRRPDDESGPGPARDLRRERHRLAPPGRHRRSVDPAPGRRPAGPPGDRGVRTRGDLDPVPPARSPRQEVRSLRCHGRPRPTNLWRVGTPSTI